MCDTNQPSGDQIIKLADDKRIIVNVGSGAVDLGDKLFSLPEFDPSLSSGLDPKTGEMIVYRDGNEVARLQMDSEPWLPAMDLSDAERAEIMRAHLDPTTCWDYNAPSTHFGDPSTIKGPLIGSGSPLIIAHHCPGDKD